MIDIAGIVKLTEIALDLFGLFCFFGICVCILVISRKWRKSPVIPSKEWITRDSRKKDKVKVV